MYENNFWYLFDVKKLTSLNYDNLKNYYVNFDGFLKLDNFFDLDGIDLFSDLKVSQEILPKKKKKRQRQIYLILSRN
jgi:glucan-binding YG repeat protein